MNRHFHTSRQSLRALSLALGLAGALLLPGPGKTQEINGPETTAEEISDSGRAKAETPEALLWARIDYLRNRVRLVPRDQNGRRARISDVLSVGDSLRTARASRAELRFNDGSLARVGERAIFRFTPNTRNFQLSNGTILLLIPPGRGRSTIQTPNATTGIQGSALFVRYIPETDTTIVGALTNNPDGPMVLINRDGTEQQALRANEIGVIQGDQITELYEFDGTLFWQSSGLAEGFNYLSDTASSGNPDQLDGVRQEIREAISTQSRLSGDSVITNPEAFSAPAVETEIIDESEAPTELEFRDSPAEGYLEGDVEIDERALDVGVNNTLSASEPENDVASESGDEAPEGNQPTEQQTTEQQAEEQQGNDAQAGDSSPSGSESENGPARSNPNSGNSAGSNPSGSNPSEGNQSPDPSTPEMSVPDGGSEENATPAAGAPDATTAIESEAVESETIEVRTEDASGPTDIRVEDAGAGNATPADSSPANDVTNSVPSPNVEADPSATPPGNGASVPGADIPTQGSTPPASNAPAPGLDNSVGPNNSQTANPASAAVSNSAVNAGADISVTAETTVAPEIETVPEGDIPLIQPIPDSVEKLDEVQPIHDMEMHDPDDTITGNSAPAPGNSVPNRIPNR